MICEKTGVECNYLGVLQSLKEDLPLERAISHDFPEEYIGAIEDGLSQTIDRATAVDCTDNFCGAVSYALASMVETEVRLTRIEKTLGLTGE